MFWVLRISFFICRTFTPFESERETKWNFLIIKILLFISWSLKKFSLLLWKSFFYGIVTKKCWQIPFLFFSLSSAAFFYADNLKFQNWQHPFFPSSLSSNPFHCIKIFIGYYFLNDLSYKKKKTIYSRKDVSSDCWIIVLARAKYCAVRKICKEHQFSHNDVVAIKRKISCNFFFAAPLFLAILTIALTSSRRRRKGVRKKTVETSTIFFIVYAWIKRVHRQKNKYIYLWKKRMDLSRDVRLAFIDFNNKISFFHPQANPVFAIFFLFLSTFYFKLKEDYSTLKDFKAKSINIAQIFSPTLRDMKAKKKKKKNCSWILIISLSQNAILFPFPTIPIHDKDFGK